MSSVRARVEARIREAIPDARVEVVDMTGTDDHLQARVVSPAFEGMSRIQRHRMVYAPLREWIEDDTVHALSVVAKAPDEIE
ncbi:MAG: BolA family protein [Gemmatimonadota bacterium]|nr:BolA family protein [Gemmatimonadota bacterium]